MRQQVFSYKNQSILLHDLKEFKKTLSEPEITNTFFQVFSTDLSRTKIDMVTGAIADVFPKNSWIGSSTSGNIVDCETDNNIIITAHTFELPTSKFETFQFCMRKYKASDIYTIVLEEAAKRPWVKAIELYWTITDFSTTELCEGLKGLDPDILVYGGIVCSLDITSSDSLLFCSKSGYCDKGIQLVFYGGDDFHVDALKISGWKPIGRNFLVTKASGSRLYELGGVPAYEIYKKYLNIRNDDNFFYNALDFPMMYEHNDTTIVRAPSSSHEDGSLTLSSDVEVGEIIRLSYGDPQTIIHSVMQENERIKTFNPDVMHVFSCAARKAFWAPYEPTYEIESLKGISPVMGFFSHGEFIREKGHINQHNITLVIASMREGEKDKKVSDEPLVDQYSSGRLPLAARMATFIRETSYELEEINSTLELMNHQLEGLASMDSLTNLKNRLAYNEFLNGFVKNDADKSNFVMLMMDVNGLKYTNDTFGHLAGDELIISAGEVIEKVFGKTGHCFRIGGDEFAVIINADKEKMRSLMRYFHKAVKEHNDNSLYRLSIAVGESRYKNASGNYKSLSDWKLDADLNMYRDKSLMHRRTSADVEVQNHKELIRCLITIEEAKDPYTAHHSDRVCSLSGAIARLIGLTDTTVNMIQDAAHLHDIGKVGVSDSILTKPSSLSRDEIEVIKEHTIIGARILMQSNYTQELVQIVLHHHERFDGTGYPDRLTGTEIPIGARIVALADSIDAMTSRRVYRGALSLRTCYEEIEKNLGVIYDPAIGRIVLDNWQEIENILMLHPKRLIAE